MKKLFLILVNIVFIFNISLATEISGEVEVIDGDTVKINGKKIRLFGIDAPEKNQICKKNWLSVSFFTFNKNYYCGKVTTKKLKKFILNKEVKCIGNQIDRYNRLIAICYVRSKDINMWLVRNGLAVSYKKYSSKYLHQEKLAKKEKIGLWQGKFDMPWEWRKKNK